MPKRAGNVKSFSLLHPKNKKIFTSAEISKKRKFISFPEACRPAMLSTDPKAAAPQM
ncbi:MAG: hypothetical protein LKJ80_03970 [Oscillibacter sp.]|jgi:hypothetical protein|nr:hypothetical protein [Oscillibacter sp.]